MPPGRSIEPFRLDYVETMLVRFVIDHFDVPDLIIPYSDKRFLHLRKAIFPGITAGIIAIEVSNRLHIAIGWSLGRPAIGTIPAKFLTEHIV